LFSATPKRPLPINEPEIKNNDESRGTPLRLIRPNFIEVISVAEEKRQERQDQGRRSKQRHCTGGEPQPPVATRKLP